MSFDTSSLPISGGVLIAGALYVCGSIFITGPLVAERTIEKSGWENTCEAGLISQAESTRTPPKRMPRTDCQALVGSFLPQLGQLCHQYGNPDFGGPTRAMLEQQERRRRDMEDRRIAMEASKAGTQCACAASVVAQDRSWAIHAGSLRLVTPTKVEHLDTQLSQALGSPHCSAGV